ncbi:MAG: methyltransferase domain-containing protein [Chloroflexi bacterium]|nr:methyltransferase domain-containing protein [Chloroflexota bacterium]
MTTLSQALSAYPRLTWRQRTHLRVRWLVCPLQKIASYVPKNGVIVDLGCGHGLFTLLLARGSAARQVIGIDLDRDKIALAQTLRQENLRFIAGDIAQQTAADLPAAQAVTITDVLYLVPYAAQEQLLRACAARLAADGVLVLKEMAERPRWKAWLNWLEETLAVRLLRITETTAAGFYFRPRADWMALLESMGFCVEVIALDKGYYHPHAVFVARRTGQVREEKSP